MNKVFHLPAIRIITQNNLAARENVTLYLKGFLSPGESPGDFEEWFRSHNLLSIAHSKQWGPLSMGYNWQSGALSDTLAPFFPVPLASASTGLWMAYSTFRKIGARTPAVFVGAVAADMVYLGGRLVYQYWLANKAAHEQAGILSQRLLDLKSQYKRVRVVAHSLGCRHLIAAVVSISPENRPHEIHLCAPAFTEEEVGNHLHGLAQEKTILYYAKNDAILGVCFRFLTQKPAIGETGPLKTDYKGLIAIDVSSRFKVFVHTKYAENFHKFAYIEEGKNGNLKREKEKNKEENEGENKEEKS